MSSPFAALGSVPSAARAPAAARRAQPLGSSRSGFAAATPIITTPQVARRNLTMDAQATAAADKPKAISGADFVRPHLKTLAPYTPIQPFEILSEKLGMAPEDIVKLDANENPYGPPPEVAKALGEMKFTHIYPDPETSALRKALAADTNTPMENILVGCGADELIDLLMRCCLDPGDTIIDTPPTFTMYIFDCEVNAGRTITIPRKPDFSIDVPAIKAAVEEHKPKMLFLTSPNNPDGSMIKEEDLVECLKLNTLVVLDEAYIEFSGEESRMPWVLEHENLVVLRTFSKRAGLAGMRVGYGAFPSSLITWLWRAKQPYNVSVASETAAVAALSNPAYLESVKQKLLAERGVMMEMLEALPYLEPYPSHANFILCRVVGGKDAGEIKNALAAKGVMVRHYSKKELSGYIRISVGRPEQTVKLEAALRALI